METYIREGGKKNMKLGILTYHRSINYGAVMQSYALSQRLKEISSVEVEIIDYISSRMDRYYKLFTLYRGKNGMFRIFDRVTMYKAFLRGIERLPLSEKKLVTDDVEKFFDYIEGKYDTIVVGSDAVWNYERRGLPNPYFLMNDINIHKLSYAASCNGIKYNQLNNEKFVILKQSYDNFEYIGVRDQLTETLVSRATGKNVTHHNCDPTFLLDFDKDGLGSQFVDELIIKLQKKYQWDTRKKHIGLMLSNLNGNLAKVLVDNLKMKYGKDYQIVSIYSYCKYADIPYIADLTPFEWSRIFSLFDITFSKYFHGILLSILNGTPVISLSAEEDIKDIPAKIEDVLSRLNLMEFYYPASGAADINWGEFMKTVDILIRTPPKMKMKHAVENEKRSAESFFDFIKTLC